MSLETAQKLKKVFILAVIIILAISALLAFVSAFFGSRKANFDSASVSMMAPSSLGMSEKSFSRDSFAGLVSDESMPSPIPPEQEFPASSEIPIIERKLMQDGNLSLVVAKVEDSVDSLSGVASKFGGRIDSVNYQDTEKSDKKRATVILRVPAANFANAMTETKALAIKVTSENISTRDVTEQFVDMQARLKTLKSTEEQYLEIMKKAVKIDDILNISQYLSNVRTQIEQIQGQMNYLSRQVDMSIITIYLTSEPEINPGGVIWNPATTAKDAMRSFVEFFYAFANAVIRLVLFWLPLLILIGVFAFLVFLFYAKVLKPWYLGSRDIFHF